MGKFILADNQELTRFALESLILSRGDHDIYKVSDKAGLVEKSMPPTSSASSSKTVL